MIAAITWDLTNMGTGSTLGWIDLIMWTVGILSNLGVLGHMWITRP